MHHGVIGGSAAVRPNAPQGFGPIPACFVHWLPGRAGAPIAHQNFHRPKQQASWRDRPFLRVASIVFPILLPMPMPVSHLVQVTDPWWLLRKLVRGTKT